LHVALQLQVEGNYLFLEQDPWCQLQALFDDTWFCDIHINSAMQRVFERQTAIGVTPDQSRVRIATNDRPNGETSFQTGLQEFLVTAVPYKTPHRSTLGSIQDSVLYRGACHVRHVIIL